MKYIIAACLVLAAGCGKHMANNSTIDTDKLRGTWELREAQNGMMPTKQHGAGNGDFFRFTQTNFEQHRDGKQERTGSYAIVADTTVRASVGLELPKDQFTHRIIFDSDTTADKTFIDLRGDTLIFLTGFFPVDAGSRQTFVRVKENR